MIMILMPSQGFFFVSTNCTAFKSEAQLQFINQANNYCNTNSSWHGLAYVGFAASASSLPCLLGTPMQALPLPASVHGLCACMHACMQVRKDRRRWLPG